jgi:hypothetical protein
VPKATGTKGPAPGGALEATYAGTVQGTSWQVVHWFQTDGSSDSSLDDLDYLLGQLYRLFAENIIAPCCGQDLHFHWGHLFSFDGERLRHRKAGTAVGAVAGELAPAQVATLIDWNVHTPGKGGNACSYIPGVPMRNLADNAHFRDDALAAMQLGARSYIEAVNRLYVGAISFVHFSVMSWVSVGAYRRTGLNYPVLGAHVRRVPATQRRRIDREA